MYQLFIAMFVSLLLPIGVFAQDNAQIITYKLAHLAYSNEQVYCDQQPWSPGLTQTMCLEYSPPRGGFCGSFSIYMMGPKPSAGGGTYLAHLWKLLDGPCLSDAQAVQVNNFLINTSSDRPFYVTYTVETGAIAYGASEKHMFSLTGSCAL